MPGSPRRRNTIVATMLVLTASAGIGFMVGGGGSDDNGPTLRTIATPPTVPATPDASPVDLPPFFRIVDDPARAMRDLIGL